MALTLQVTSFQHQALGSEATKSFGGQGGTIGRSGDNDWVLPDPERFISGHHAKIICRQGTYYLCDTSSNGTFVNGSSRAIGSGSEQQLFEGDRLRIGEYEIVVGLESAAQQPSPNDSAAHQQFDPVGSGIFGPPEGGRPSNVDPLDVFGGPEQPRAPAPPAAPDHGSAMEQHYVPPAIGTPAQQSSFPGSGQPAGHGGGAIPDDWDKTGFSSPETPAYDPFSPSPGGPQGLPQQPAPPQPPVPPAQPVPGSQPDVSPSAPAAFGDAAATLAAILQLAGMDAASARAAASSPGVGQALGALLGVVVHGMLELLKARSEIKSQFRVPVTMIRANENNPLKFSATPAQALEAMLHAQNQAYMGLVDAFAEGFDDIKAHQMAMMAGMRAAFDELIRRFDPEYLAERFDRHAKRGALLSKPGKGRYWDMYTDLYSDLTQDADLNFQKLFGDEFSRAYEEQMRRFTTHKGGT